LLVSNEEEKQQEEEIDARLRGHWSLVPMVK
jgi:hypothetical protein